MPPRRRTTKAEAPVVEEVEEDLLESDEDLEELDDEPAPAPKRRGRPAKAAEETPARAARKAGRPAAKAKAEVAEEKAENYGTAWLVNYVNDQLDTEHDAKSLRVLLRKATEAGVLDRDDNSRYQFTGEGDRKVARLLKFIRDNEREAPAEKPAARKAPTAVKRTAPAAKAAPAKRRTRKAEPVDDDPDMPDYDEDEIDEL